MDFCIYSSMPSVDTSIEIISSHRIHRYLPTQFSSDSPVTGFQSLIAVVSGLLRHEMFCNISFVRWWKLSHLPFMYFLFSTI